MSDPTYVGDAAAQLQKLLSERRHLSSMSLSMDGYERWGQGSDPGFEALFADLGDVGARQAELNQAFSVGIEALRASDPAAVVALARAHQALLQGCIERAGDDSTNASVAREEIAEWRGVEIGTANLVKQNCYYVHYDRTAFEAFFGFKLGWPIAGG